MTLIAVGQRWPHPLADAAGMQGLIDQHEGAGLSLTLVAIMPGLTTGEVATLRKAPVRLALKPGGRILWLAADWGTLAFDAPWSADILPPDRRVALAAGAHIALGLPKDRRGLVEVVGVDSRTDAVVSVRALSCSRAWWRVLATAVGAMVAVAGESMVPPHAHAASIQEAMRRIPSTADLIRSAVIVERGGKV